MVEGASEGREREVPSEEAREVDSGDINDEDKESPKLADKLV